MRVVFVALAAQLASALDDELCGGARIFVYDLPRFAPNATAKARKTPLWDIADSNNSRKTRTALRNPNSGSAFGFPCASVWDGCRRLEFLGMGPRFELEGMQLYDTTQFALDLLAIRFINMFCRTTSLADANLFYIPLPVAELQELGRKRKLMPGEGIAYMESVKAFLSSQPAWQQGEPHFVVLPETAFQYEGEGFGDFLHHGFALKNPFWASVTFVTIEGAAKHPNLLSVPYPTTLHPRTERDLETWLKVLASTPQSPRAVLIAGEKFHDDGIRSQIIDACNAEPLCHFEPVKNRRGAKEPSLNFTQTAVSLYLSSTFSLQPAGDTPTRKGFFDSLVAKCIPIVFHGGRLEAPPEPWWLERTYGAAYARYFSGEESWIKKVALVAESVDDAMRLVRETPPEVISRLQRNILDLLPSLLYWNTIATDTSSASVHRNVFTRMLRRLMSKRDAK